MTVSAEKNGHPNGNHIMVIKFGPQVRPSSNNNKITK